DGTARWFRDETMEVFDKGGTFLFRQGIMLDITVSKQTEEMLRLHRDRLAALSRQLLTVRETEQRAIGRELHDQIGQMLTAVQITLEMLPQLPAELAARKLERAREITQELLDRVSLLSLKLRPPMLDDQGLLPALLWHVRRYHEQSGLEVNFQHTDLKDKRFEPEIETTAYRVIQESLTNIARHAQATLVKIDIAVGEEDIEIHIWDNGKGFDPVAAYKKNRGLGGMRERINLLSGRIWIESKPGLGTHIAVHIPVKEMAQ
ncbi:MAG: sensor histidine kinase, partial [Chloroflexota bacterium]|nr:sensor histidine kinase [Chloroflexota bacterium]